MGIFADVTLLGGVTISNIYISPRYISATRDVGHYVLDYLSKRNGAALPIPSDYSIIEFKGAGREKPGDNPLRRSGVVYDRNKPAHEQVYADLREKLKAGQVPWLTNVRNEDGSPFVDGTAALAAFVPEPEAEAPLLPAPDALLSDWGEVGETEIDPNDAETVIDGFVGELREGREVAEETMRGMVSPDRKKLFSILNGELGRLKNEEALLGKSIPRRADVESLLGILARVGEA